MGNEKNLKQTLTPSRTAFSEKKGTNGRDKLKVALDRSEVL